MMKRSLLILIYILIITLVELKAQWISQISTNKDLWAIQILNTSNGYVVGQDETVFKGSNFGSSWIPLTTPTLPPPLRTFYDVCFLTDNTGWIVGNSSTIFITSNMGVMWDPPETALPVNFASLFDCERFKNDVFDYIWVGGSNSVLYRTEDNGKIWHNASTGISGAVQEIKFKDNLDGFLATTTGIFVTTNSGANWNQVGGITGTYTGLAISSDGTYWAVGLGGSILYLQQSSNDWVDVGPEEYATANFSSVAAISDKEIYVSGTNGLVISSPDTGRTWNEVSLDGDGEMRTLLNIFALDSDNIWIVGNNGANFYSEGTVQFGANSIPATRFEIGTMIEIPFETTFNSFVDIHFRSDNDPNWTLESSNYLASIGNYPWKMPSIPSIGYRLRIRSSQKQQVEVISPPFEIFQKTLTVNIPTENDTAIGGTMFRIEWEHENVENVEIWLQVEQTTDSIRIALPMAISDETNQIFDWPVPLDIKSDQCRVRIFEQDGSPLAISEIFTVTYDSDPPEITVDPTNLRPIKGVDLEITAIITDINRTQNTLFYRQGGMSTYFNKELLQQTIDTTVYKATIFQTEPNGLKIDERGLEFYIQSVDESPSAHEAYFPGKEQPQYLPVVLDTLVHTVIVSSPGDEEVYKLISMPYDLDQPNIRIILEDEDNYGPYDPHNWRVWFWQDDTAGYIEAQDDNFIQGRSFWIANNVKNTFVSKTGKSYKPLNFGKTLQPGWNQIGNPFAFNVSVNEVFASSSNLAGINVIYGYPSNQESWQPASFLESGKGYFVRNPGTTDVILTIPPMASTGSVTSQAKKYQGDGEWTIKLKVQSISLIDSYNLVGISESSSYEWDNLDHPEPPPVIGNHISLSFPHYDWQVFPGSYTTDFRPEVIEGEIWDFNIETNMVGLVAEIHFEGIEDIPSEYEVYIFDKNLNISQSLRDNPTYRFVTASKSPKTEFSFIVGESEFFENKDLELNQIPFDFELSQNFPNPFNPATTIRYGLPQASTVTLTVYNLLGKEVAVLLYNEPKEAGYHLEVWDGLDNYGYAATSGLYFYEIKVGSWIKTMKMLLAK